MRLALAALLIGVPALVSAHSWYPAECCSDKDCAPYPSSDVRETVDGFHIVSTGEFVARHQARVSPDGDYHLCRLELSQALICFFAPIPNS